MPQSSNAPSPAKPPREVSLDVIRCYAMSLVVIAHVAAELLAYRLEPARYVTGTIFLTIGFTAVPLLLMISGALLLRPLPPEKELPPGSFFWKRLPKLLIPMVAWSFIYYVRNHFTEGISIYIPTFFKRFATVSLEGHLWYLYMLLGVYLMLPFLRAMDFPTNRRLGWWFVGVCFFYPVLQFCSTTMLGSAPYPPLGDGFPTEFLGYVVLGMLLTTRKTPSTKWTSVLLFTVFGCWISTLLLDMSHSLVHGHVTNLYFQQYSPFIITMGIATFLLFRQISWQFSAGWTKRIISLSTLTFGIYLVHILIIQFLAGRFGHVFQGDPFPPLTVAALFGLGLPDWVIVLLLGGLVYGLSGMVTYVIRRIPLLRNITP